MNTKCKHDTSLCARCIARAWIFGVLWRNDWRHAIRLFYPEAKA